MPDIFDLLSGILGWLTDGVAILLGAIIGSLVYMATAVVQLISGNMPLCTEPASFAIVPAELLSGFRSAVAFVEPFTRWYDWGTMWQIIELILLWRFIEWLWPWIWKAMQWIWSALSALVSLIPFS